MTLRRLSTALLGLALLVPAAPATAEPRSTPDLSSPGGAVPLFAVVEQDDGSLAVRRGAARDAADARGVLARWRGQRGVLSAEVDGVVRASATNDPLYPEQWGLRAVRAEAAWSSGDASTSVVAVLDSGVDVDHPDLAPALLPGINTAVRTTPPPPPPGQPASDICHPSFKLPSTADVDDRNGHGTHVAGIAGAVTGNATGVAGAALGVKVLPVKVLMDDGSGCTSDLVEGINHAVQRRATVINLSLGGPRYSSGLATAVQSALDSGVPVVAAMGNSSSAQPEYPAALPGVVAVSATDQSGLQATFSNTGSHNALAAPGVGVLSTIVDDPRTQRVEQYGYLSGTSMSTPFVSAAVALLRAREPGLTPAAVGDRLRATAVDAGGFGRDDAYGWGVLDMAAVVRPTAGSGRDWLLRQTSDPGPAQSVFTHGLGDDVTLACDFDGDGRDTAALYRAGRWAVRNEAGPGVLSAVFTYGDAGMQPVCGDWDGDGRDGVGVYAGGTWYLRETATAGSPDRLFTYGWSAARPVVGRWGGTAGDGIGVYADGRWLLRRTATAGSSDAAQTSFGWSAAQPVPGDWNGDGVDTLGVYAEGSWYLRDALTPGPARTFAYGAGGYAPVVGDWDGVGPAGVGVTRQR